MKRIEIEELEQQKKNEENTKAKYITPILKERWGVENKENIILEYVFTDGRVNVEGDKVKRGGIKKADYMLLFKNNIPLALVEAKGIDHSAMEGYQQVIEYAKILDIPFAYTTNGIDLIEEDLIKGINNSNLKMADFPYPDTLWNRYLTETGMSEEDQGVVCYPDYVDIKNKKPRYYQRIAINRVLEAIAQGKKRMLLVMATGTGKTFTAFQIVWKLWKTKTMKKILYLVDRNALADQTMQKDFRPFVDAGVMVKMRSDRIKQDTAYEVFTALYQQLIYKDEKYYQQLPPDFFDFIIVDECHRGSVALDSNWHEMLEYFNSATQLGLTATPRETEDLSNIGYFCQETDNKPTYTYSLKQGIEDGFLAPYRVISVELNIDKEGYIPPVGKLDVNGEPIERRTYTQKDFDRNIVVEERREIVAQRITDYLKDNDCRYSKTIVFCENIEHCDSMLLLLKNLNQDLVQENPKYIMKITGDDDKGKAEIENFIDPNVKYPVVAITSKLLSTGIDTETVELIVLDKSIGSMTEFKQTIGRGTRIKEKFTIDKETKDKLHFTILDFRKNYLQFKDPNFDGEPVSISTVGEVGGFPKGAGQKLISSGDRDTDEKNKTKRKKVKVNGVVVTIQDEEVRYTDEDGNLIKQDIESCVKNNILDQYPTLEDFFEAWLKAEDKNTFANALLLDDTYIKKVRSGFEYNIDKFDIIAFAGYQKSPKSKEERLENVYQSDLFTSIPEEKQGFLKLVLREYIKTDFQSLKDPVDVFALPVVKEAGYTPLKIIRSFFGGKKDNYIKCITELEQELYRSKKLWH